MPTFPRPKSPSIPVHASVHPARDTTAPQASRASFVLRLSAAAPSAGARDLVVALDRSSSMEGQPLADALRALRTLVRAAPDGMALSAFAFDADVTSLFQRTVLDGESRPALLERIQGIGHGLGTNHSAALLEGFGRARGTRGAAHLLLLTDGYPSRGLTRLEPLVDLVRQGAPQATTSTIGLGRSAEGWVLGALARAGGGIYQHAPNSAAIEPAIGAELGLLAGLHSHDVRARFMTRAPVTMRKLYHRGPAWHEDGDRVLGLPRLVVGEPLEVAFELERAPGDGAHPWGLVEIRLRSPDGSEQRLELPLPADLAPGPGTTDCDAIAAILRHRVGVAILDACAARDDERAAAGRWLRERLTQLRAVAADHQLAAEDLEAAFARAKRLEALLGDAPMSHQDKTGFTDLAELCLRGVSSIAAPLPKADGRDDMGTRVRGVQSMLRHRED